MSQDLGLAPPEGEQRHARRASEALMKHYYWAAKAVTQLNQIVHLNMQEWLFEEATAHPPLPLNAFFVDKSGMLDVVDDDVYQRHPEAILQTFCSTKKLWASKGFLLERSGRFTTLGG